MSQARVLLRLRYSYNFNLKMLCSDWLIKHHNQYPYMGQKLQDGKKVLCVSLNSPHSKRPPGKTAGLSNLPFWILGSQYGVNTHKKFHVPGTIFKGLKFKGKNGQNGHFFIILPLNFRPLKWFQEGEIACAYSRHSDCQKSKGANC